MGIKILGAKGCQVCENLEQTVFEVLSELGVNAVVDKIDDANQILKYDVFSIPALVINGQVKESGRAFSKQEITKLIKESNL